MTFPVSMLFTSIYILAVLKNLAITVIAAVLAVVVLVRYRYY